MRTLLIAALALLTLGGCSAGENLEVVEREVTRFHRLAAGGQYDRLYDEATPELKRAASARVWRDLMTVVDERLGVVQRKIRRGWHVNYTTGGTIITATYETHFERGQGTEQFIYRIENERPLLLGYHINSPALMARPGEGRGEGGAQERPDAERDSNATSPIVTAPMKAE